jgi:hypothetical protein
MLVNFRQTSRSSSTTPPRPRDSHRDGWVDRSVVAASSTLSADGGASVSVI